MRHKTNSWVLAGIVGIFACTYALGEQSFVEMMKTAETNCSPIVVELGVINHIETNLETDDPPTISPKNSDYTSTEKWYIAGEKYRYEQSFSLSSLGYQSSVSVYDGTQYKKFWIDTKPRQNKFGIWDAGPGYLTDLSEHVFGRFEEPWSMLTNTSFTTNFVENGAAVIGCTSIGGTQIRIEIATNKSGFAEAMQIRIKTNTNAFSRRIETELTQWGHSSNWFPRAHRFYSYFHGHKRLTKEVFVKSVQFNAIISNEVFQLSFPPGTRVCKEGKWSIQP